MGIVKMAPAASEKDIKLSNNLKNMDDTGEKENLW